MQTNRRLKIVAKTALVRDDGRFLVLTRSNTDNRRPGGLDFPGGEIDPGEDILAGAAREIQEEAGITINPSDMKVLFAKTSPPDVKGEVVTRVLCAARTDQIDVALSFEHSAFKWCTLKEILDQFEPLSWAEGLRFAIKHEVITLA